MALRIAVLGALILAGSILFPAPAAAQIPIVTGVEDLAWDVVDPTITTAAAAQADTYTPVVDLLKATGKEAAFVGVTCTGDARPFVCRVKIMTLTPGVHAIRVLASRLAEDKVTVLKSLLSDPLSVQWGSVSPPAAPTNVRIIAP